MANQRFDFTTPVGRMVGGSIYVPKKTDHLGKPRFIKNGPNAGQPHESIDFAIAIPKTGVPWKQTEWGKQIDAAGQSGFPQHHVMPTFAWKVTDGDSTIPNKNLKRPCDAEGYAGNWVLWFSSGTAPQVWNKDGSQRIVEEGAIKPGYYIQVFGNATSNGSTESPGVFINHSMVALTAYGIEIQTGPDVSAAGFGQGVQLPPGASATPVGNFSAPAAPGAVSTVAPPAIAVSTIVPVVPNPAILVPPPVHRMTDLAQGATYEQCLAAGWTDATLIQHGLMLP